jgi:hypothetical protein
MATKLIPNPHPRLYMGPDVLARVRRRTKHGLLQTAAAQVERDAAHYAEMPPLTYPRNVHNEHLHRAREVQTRVMALLVRWAQTGEECCRRAVLDYVKLMNSWSCWSWITWRQNKYEPNAIFDLSYGENSVTLALAYDWLYDTLSDKERALVLDVARRRALGPFVYHVAHKQWPDWYNFTNNWNAVCSGGGGVLALAMYEDLPEARKAVAIAERTLPKFMGTLKAGGGGWVEGTGYWNYGMCYAFRYMMSFGNTTGKSHPLMRLPILRKTMSFPFDFSPHGNPCSFGDNNRWSPLPFHYAAASRFGQRDVMAKLDAHLEEAHGNGKGGHWRNAAEWLALHPGKANRRTRSREGRTVRLYKGLDWGVLADDKADPELHLSYRGGTTRVPHSNRDLLSFHCVVGRERMIASLSPAEYLDTTGSSRRMEMFENGPWAKNTIFINGVGITEGSSLDRTELIKLPGADGVRLVATSAMGEMRDGPMAKFCGRAILMLEERAYLIVDRASLHQVGRMESRMHTHAEVKCLESGATLKGETERMRVSYACNVPAVFRAAGDAPTRPTDPESTLLRWCIVDQHKDITMATLLCPGSGAASVEIATEGSRLAITVTTRTWKRKISLTKQLRPV